MIHVCHMFLSDFEQVEKSILFGSHTRVCMLLTNFDVSPDKFGPCLVHPENQKVFKILCHIEFFGTCMKH